jgi:hypothetical protein
MEAERKTLLACGERKRKLQGSSEIPYKFS